MLAKALASIPGSLFVHALFYGKALSDMARPDETMPGVRLGRGQSIPYPPLLYDMGLGSMLLWSDTDMGWFLDKIDWANLIIRPEFSELLAVQNISAF